jgi:phosphoinositide-3-kinase regulatory subunit 4
VSNKAYRRSREATEQPARPEAQLANGEQISLGDLGVTPQTVFISPRTIGMDAQANLRRLKPHLTTGTSSRRTSFASRSNRGAIDNPLDEIRKRLAPLEPHAGARPGDAVSSEPPIYAPGQSPSDSAISSSLDLAALPRSAKKRVEQKVAPAVAAVHTTALGTTSIHDEPASGRSTPTINGPATPRGPAAPYSSSYEGQDPGVRAFLEQVDLENYREPLLDFGPKVVASQRKHPSRGKSSSSGVTMIAHLAEHTGTITSIVTSPDQVFFATASEDRSILIWDTARLERSVYSKPRLTYRLDAPVTAMCRIENQHCLAAAAEDGQLHLLRVHVVTPGASAKYGKVECLRTWQTPEPDGHITFVHHLQGEQLDSTDFR